MSNFGSKVLEKLRVCTQNQGFKEFLAEFIGTFCLIAFGDASIAAYQLKSRGAPVDVFATCFCFAIGGLVGIAASLNISGGHINPAVTLSLAVIRKFEWKKVWYYMLSQYLGGFCAAAIVYFTYCDALAHYDDGVRSAFGHASSTGGIFATYPAPFMSLFGALIDEVVATALLLFGILAIVDPKNLGASKGMIPVAVGLLIGGACVAFGLNCGATLNPARDLSPRLLTAIAGYGWEPFYPLGGHYWWLVGIVAPHVGGIIGAVIYLWTVDSEGMLGSGGSGGDGGDGETQPLVQDSSSKEGYKSV